MDPLRILIVDDHQAVRRGVRSLLSGRSEWSVCDEAADGIEAIEKVKKHLPDIVVMDVSMPRMDGVEATRIIRREAPGSQVIIISQNDASVVNRQAAEVGAWQYIAKSDLGRYLVPALEKITGTQPDENKAKPRKLRGEWLFGGGTLGRLIREFDWSETPIGALRSWPQSLKTSVNLMLNSQHPMWIGWGPEITFLYNDAYLSVLGLAKHPQSLGRPAREVWQEIWDVCGPLALKVFSDAEPSFVDDVRLFMSRGEYLEETYYSFSYSPIYDESGKVAGLFCPSTETTAKVLNARRLRTLSELSAKALVEKSTEAACASSLDTISANPDDVPFALLYLIDEDGRRARLQGTSRIAGDLEPISPREVVLESQCESLLWPMKQVVRTSEAQTVPLAHLAGLPDGPSNQPVNEAVVLPLTAPGQDRPVGILIAGVNPTRKLDLEHRTFFKLIADQVATAIQNARAAEEEKRRADALAEIDRAKTAFFSNVSHEFRTPLTLMLGPLEDTLAETEKLPPEHRERLQVAHRNSLRLLRLVNTLLDFSRLEAGRIQANYEPVELSVFTAELASVFRSTIERAGLKLIVNCEPLGETVYVDREMWEKMVFNLLSNAFKFTLKGEIEVILRVAGNTARLSVRDSGIGIPEEELPHLFERFHRVKGAHGRTMEGSGIGLALVQELAKLHGGSVEAESRHGSGSKFTVSVPLGKTHLAAERIRTPSEPASTKAVSNVYVEEASHWLPDPEQEGEAQGEPQLMGGSVLETWGLIRKRVLLADDNSDMREYVRRLLAANYSVEAVADGQAALEAARRQRPDLILTDVMMPKLSGFELLRELRADAGTATVPIILLSARAGEESRVQGLAAGADDYLVKPFSARELITRVETHLKLSEVRRETEDRLRQKETALASSVRQQKALFQLVDRLNQATTIDDAYAAALDAITAALECDRASILLYDKNKIMRFASWRGLSDAYRSTTEGHSPWAPDVSDPKPVAVENLDNADFAPELMSIIRSEGIRALAFIPLVANGALIGKFMAYFDRPHVFTPEEFDLALAISQQLAFGIERRRTEETLQQHRERFELVTRSSQLGFWFCDLPFDKLIWDDRVKEHFWLPPEAEVTIETFYARLHAEDREPTRQAIESAITSKAPYDVEYRTVAADGQEKWIRAIGLAIYDESGKPTRFDGVTLDVTQRKRDEQSLIASEERFRRLAESLDAEVRLRTKELEKRNEDVLRQSEQLRSLSARLMQIQDDERRHIARELHDSAGQLLTALNMNLAALEDQTTQENATALKESRDLVQQLSQEIRTMSYLLHPPLLDESGLSPALSWYVQGLGERSGLRIELNIAEDFGRLPRDMELAVFRLIQESLTNIHRHSGSNVATIRVSREGHNVCIEVEDRGRGMSAEKLQEIQARGSGVGIRGMRERIRQFQGEMTIQSNSPGTRITVILPITTQPLSKPASPEPLTAVG